jgi:uncharacterized protein with NAD-binding domain and iron-sulfur cluster
LSGGEGQDVARTHEDVAGAGRPEGALTRREALQRAAAGGAAAAVTLSPAGALAAPRRRVRTNGREVAVLGGGMAGLAAAHELVERGFRVTVYERKALGGKARSIPVPGTAAGGRRALPGEHGFRFFPGFYHHVPDSMRRTPFPGNEDGVWNNLVDAMGTRSVRANGRADAQLFGVVPDPQEAGRPGGIERLLVAEILKQQGVPPHEAEYFTNRVMVFLTSSDERRYGQWEHTSWWDFVGAATRSEEYRQVIAKGLTRSLVAAKETVASTRTIGNMAEAFVMNIMQRGNDGAPDRVLNAPTNEAWIDPWVVHLRKLGVRFRVGQTVEALDVRRGRVAAARARDRRGRRRRIDADWFVCAMPAERARRLWSRRVLAAAPELEGMRELQVDWMNGIQFYLRRKVEITKGHVTFVDAPWALTALTQAQFWAGRDFPRDYGDGSAVDCLSVDVSDWDTPGILYGKPAKRCTPAEVKNEVWAQMQAHFADTGEGLTDDILHSWFLDPGIAWVKRRQANRNDEPLLVNTVGSWEKRPEAGTAIPNLLLAGDYVRTDIDLATMEGANESGREAVNVLLERSGSKAEPVRKFKLYDPPEFEAAKRADAELFRAGQPNALDHHP